MPFVRPEARAICSKDLPSCRWHTTHAMSSALQRRCPLLVPSRLARLQTVLLARFDSTAISSTVLPCCQSLLKVASDIVGVSVMCLGAQKYRRGGTSWGHQAPPTPKETRGSIRAPIRPTKRSSRQYQIWRGPVFFCSSTPAFRGLSPSRPRKSRCLRSPSTPENRGSN